jgi:hypothetical protein
MNPLFESVLCGPSPLVSSGPGGHALTPSGPQVEWPDTSLGTWPDTTAWEWP